MSAFCKNLTVALVWLTCACGGSRMTGTPGLGVLSGFERVRLHIEAQDERSERMGLRAMLAARQQGMVLVSSEAAADLVVDIGWTGNLGWDRVSYDDYRIVTRRAGALVGDQGIACSVDLANDCEAAFLRSLRQTLDPAPAAGMSVAAPLAIPATSGASASEVLRGAPFPDAYALIIGVERYRDLPAAAGAKHDAEEFAELARDSLGVPEENVRRLGDEHATRSDLEAELRWLKTNASDAARLYFYFGGHGAPDAGSGSAFLLPYDANPDDPVAAGLALDELLDRLAGTGSHEVVAFVDTCFSGAGGRSVLPAGTRPLAIVKGPSVPAQVMLFAAAGPNQVSGMDAARDGGLFTEYLFEGLGLGKADRDGDAQISLSELAAWVTPEVQRAARRAQREQTPLLQLGNPPIDPAGVILVHALQRELSASRSR